MGIAGAWLAGSLAAGVTREARPVPEGARVALAFAGTTNFVLGDVIEMTFVLSNAGPQSFPYETGGDYRGTGFPTRYRFTVTDEHTAALPKETWMDMGGIAGPRELKPGETHREPLRLQNYVRVDQPGAFTLRVGHDFGWTPTPERPLPVAEAKIQIRLPTPEEAQARVSAILSSQPPLKEDELGAYWHQTDFRYLSHPIFLSALERASAAGHVRALEGLQRIQTTNATSALVRLLASEDIRVCHAATLFLSRRMPPRLVQGYPRQPFGYVPGEEAAAYTNYWLAEAVEPLRRSADRLLRSTNVSYVRTGAFVVETIGTPEDAPAVLEALRGTLQEWNGKVRDKPEDNILNAPGAGDSLIAALAGLRERGYRAPRNGGIEVIMAQFLELADPAIPRPEGWEQTLEAFFTQNPPMLREAAVRALPKPPTGPWEKLLLGALDDRDRGVMRQACITAGESKSPVFIVPLANIVRTERQKWVVSEASEALTKLGAHWPATEAWIERLADEDLWDHAMRFLADKLEHPKSAGSSSSLPPRDARIEMRHQWQAFFADSKRQALAESGQPVPATDEQLHALLGGVFSLSLKNGQSWPGDQR